MLGLGGLVGAGRSELARLLFGADRPDSGDDDARRRGLSRRAMPRSAVRAGVGFVPEERRAEGLVLTKSVAFNLGLANLALDRLQPGAAVHQRAAAHDRSRSAMIRDLAIKTPGVETPVGKLSGGNQQKVADRPLARRRSRRC